MRYSVLGFNQQGLLENDLDLTDTLLLDYIYTACASPSMKKTHDENDQPHVWIQHKKLLEDIPIIGIGEEMLKKRLHKLVDKGLITSIVKNDEIRGRRTYYTITVKCEQLRFSDQVYSITLGQERPSVMDYPSDNKLNYIDNKLDSISTNVEIDQPTAVPDCKPRMCLIPDVSPKESIEKEKKKSRYEQCADVIDTYTQDTQLKEILLDYLSMRLAIKDKPMYVSGWKRILSTLFGLSQDVTELINIVKQSLENSWATFYPLKSNYKSKQNNDVFNEFGIVKSVPVKKEDILNEAF